MSASDVTYKYRRTCRRYNETAIPVGVSGETRWMPWPDLGPALDEAAFGCTDDPKHDRLFRVRSVNGGPTTAVETVLSRGYEGDWPSLSLFDDEQQARREFERIVSRISGDPRWFVRMQPQQAEK